MPDSELLSAGNPPAVNAEGSAPGAARNELPRADFSRPAVLPPGPLRKLKQKQRDLADGLAVRLSTYLRLEVAVRLVDLNTYSYKKFLEELPATTHIALFKVEPLRGICLIEMSPKLGLSLVDRLMGGRGVTPETTRELSDIEVALLDQVTQLILGEWCAQWRDTQEVRASIIGHESVPRFLQTAPPEAPMLVMALETQIGESKEVIRLCFPLQTVEPFLAKLHVPIDQPEPQPSRPQAAGPVWNPELNEMRVSLTASCEGIELKARDLLQLKLGDILNLGGQSAHRVQVCIGGKPKFLGRLGTSGKAWAVEIRQILHSRTQQAAM